MMIRLNKFDPDFTTDPSILWGLHSFDDNSVKVGPGHYRTGSYAVDGAGSPAGLFKVGSSMVRALNSKIYVDDTEIGSYTGSAMFTALAGLLIWTDGTGNLKAYDPDNASWLAETLGVSTPADTMTATPGAPGSGSMEAGVYYYRIAYLDAWGNEGQPSGAVTATAAALGSVVLAVIPPYTDAKKSKIRIYRTYVGGSAASYDSGYHLVAEVAATTTTYTDTLADTSLTDDLLFGTEWGSYFRAVPSGTIVTTWGNRLAWSSGNMLYVSGFNDSGGALPGETYFAIEVGDSTSITALATLGKSLLIFKATPAIYEFKESSETPFTLDLYPGGDSYGATSSRHVVPWLGGLALYCHKRVYTIPGFKDITEQIQPMFDTANTLSSVWLSVDHLHRLYVSGLVTGLGYPAVGASSGAYETYIYSPGTYGWSHTVNLDLLHIYADFGSGITYGLDKNGWFEKIDWSTIKEKTGTPINTTQFTINSATRITFNGTDTTTALKVGDYVTYWMPSATDAGKRALISQIATIHTSTSLSVADGIFTSVTTDYGIVTIGNVFFAKSAQAYDKKNGYDILGKDFRALVTTSVTANMMAFKWQAGGYPTAMSSILRDSNKLFVVQDSRKSWILTPYLEGSANTDFQINHEQITFIQDGKVAPK